MMIRQMKDKEKERRIGVLDSGATHAVRPKRKNEVVAKKIEVELAGKREVEMEMNANGTLLASEGTQVIVPMLAVIEELRCEVSTDGTAGMKLKHTRKGDVTSCTKTGSLLLAEDFCLVSNPPLIHT